jgi:hypothetical protein
LDWTDADRTILSLITPDFNPTNSDYIFVLACSRIE